MKNEFYAHSQEGTPPEHWHRLEDHLKKVAETAQTFTNDFQAGDWGYPGWRLARSGKSFLGA